METVNSVSSNKQIPSTDISSQDANSAGNNIASKYVSSITASSDSRNSFIDSMIDIFYPPKESEINLRASINDNNQAEISTSDGFKITILGKEQGFTIQRPDGGSTKIWGDPHVDESDGDRWDFYDRSTFVFGDNKITVETTPRIGKEATYSQTITIYNGEDRLTITDIHIDKPKLESWKFDGSSHDEALDDGDVFKLEISGSEESWVKQ